MSDTTLNVFLGEGDDAFEATFTPSPPTPAAGPDPAYLYVNKEDPMNPLLKWWDGSAWVTLVAVGAGAAGGSNTELQYNAAGVLDGITGATSDGTSVTLTSPTFVTPALGTPASGTLTNCTGLPISTGVSGLGANVAAALATLSSANLKTAVTDETGSGALVFADTPTLVTPVLGTPTSGTLTNCTGLPISTGVSGLAANVATALATPSSANLAAAVTDETGSGSLVFANTPTLVSPILGTPTSGTLTNCTGLPVTGLVYSGAMVTIASDATGQNYTAGAVISWDTETYDEGGWWDAGSPTIFTVPSGVTKVDITASIRLTNVTADLYVFLVVQKNSSADYVGVPQGSTEIGLGTPQLTVTSIGVPCAATDTFRVFVTVETDTSVDLDSPRSYFSIRAVD